MNCLFMVQGKASKRPIAVYDVKIEDGSVRFLVFKHGRWDFVPSDIFEPVDFGQFYF